MPLETSVYQTLLESTAAIPWKIDWKSMSFAYIGPQIETLLGWPPHSWVTVDDWAARMHADDRERVVGYCVTQSSKGCDHEADYRALCSNGTYVWIRDVVHVVRNDKGEVDALVGFMFDITERKRAEEQMAALHRELEALSYQDGLTGVANRRMFDLVCAREWANAQRSGLPLSLILFDIDFFKQYNDRYGHLAGDDCLRRVAQLLDGADKRPRDFFARYGGEEFILLLPETDAEAAAQVAERCRLLVFNDGIVHPVDTGSTVLTVSLGVGSAFPTVQDDCHAFIHLVDQRLYRAKIQGRNCVVGPIEGQASESLGGHA